MSATRLYLRCLAWGLATGAAVGAGIGLVIGTLLAVSTGPALAALALAVGTVYGAIVAIVPTVLGSLVVVVVLIRRHPHPASSDGVHRDLAVVFAAVVAVLDLAVLVYWLALGGSLSEMLAALAALLLVDAAVAAMLKPARTSIARAWVGAHARPPWGSRTYATLRADHHGIWARGGDVSRTIPFASVTSNSPSGRSLACQPGWWSTWWWREHSRTRLASSVVPFWVTQTT